MINLLLAVFSLSLSSGSISDNRVAGLGGDSTSVFLISNHLNISIHTPLFSPAVLHQPKVLMEQFNHQSPIINHQPKVLMPQLNHQPIINHQPKVLMAQFDNQSIITNQKSWWHNLIITSQKSWWHHLITNHQSSITNHQSSINHHQPKVLMAQSSYQSPIINQKSWWHNSIINQSPAKILDASIQLSIFLSHSKQKQIWNWTLFLPFSCVADP